MTVRQQGVQRDILALLALDHREAEALFTQLEQAPPGGSVRRELLNRVTRALVRHSVAEESYLHPVVRRRLEGGNRIVDMETNEHADAEELLDMLRSLHDRHVEFDIILGQLRAEMHDHMHDEEQILFPEVRRRALREELVALGRDLEEARKRPPAHQHAR